MATHSPLTVKLVAVEAQIWEGEASSVYARTTEGELGVYPGHIPMLGEVAVDSNVHLYTTEGERLDFEVTGGFISITADGVTVLAESARQVEAATA
ncbi:F0F1 ATP synthase subunit epsilon [Haloglycomyces albus]|uniref:F0F1 ATP synthase subunit epsilon n=1 Tax=Haloglycomyces albus TaxID=526067 RepID=UPI00046D5EEB|nr:F0F1 ATP synthase subunit epsilon [Haloglycomyces albus]